jgi:YedE family putative selenium metabolism protein
MLGLLALVLLSPPPSAQAAGTALGAGEKSLRSGVLFYSTAGPGSMHAPLFASLGAGLLIGFLAQRARFCTMGAFRDLILFRHPHLFWGILSLLAAAVITNLFAGQFNPGFADQPISHTLHVWNFAGMALAGLAFALAGGCPGRQLFLSGEGDADAGVFVLGMIVGAALSHNLGLASSPQGLGPHGAVGVAVGTLVCLGIGFTMRKKGGAE